jgi:hypothetical protein
MNHARILTAYLGRLSLKDLRDILRSAEACSHAQLNYGTSAQLEEQGQFDQTVAEAIDNMAEHDRGLISLTLRSESTPSSFRDTRCSFCGSTDLSWNLRPVGAAGVQDGRHKLNEIRTLLWVGCNHCFETLHRVGEDRMLDMLNESFKEHTDAHGKG